MTLKMYAMDITLLMKCPRDFLTSFFSIWLEMKDCARFDSAMSDRHLRSELMLIFQSGKVCFDGSRDEDDIIKRPCLQWLSLRALSVRNLSCCGYRRQVMDATSDLVMSVAINSPNLRSLCLQDWKNGFCGTHFQEIARLCPHIKALVFKRCNDIDTIIQHACMHIKSSVQSIKVQSCSILTDNSVIAISKYCPKLARADFSGCCQITDEGVKALAQGCPFLEEAHFLGLRQITDESIKEIANNCHAMKVLNLTRCLQLSDESIILLAKQCPHLREIYLCGCQLLTDVSVTHIAHGCPSLTYLDISGCTNVSNDALTLLAQKCGPSLRSLRLGVFPNLTDAPILALADYCPSLVELYLFSNDNVTDTAIKRLASACKLLEKLYLIRVSKMTDASLDELGIFCNHLREIGVGDSPLISRQAMWRLKQKIPKLILR